MQSKFYWPDQTFTGPLMKCENKVSLNIQFCICLSISCTLFSMYSIKILAIKIYSIAEISKKKKPCKLRSWVSKFYRPTGPFDSGFYWPRQKNHWPRATGPVLISTPEIRIKFIPATLQPWHEQLGVFSKLLRMHIQISQIYFNMSCDSTQSNPVNSEGIFIEVHPHMVRHE